MEIRINDEPYWTTRDIEHSRKYREYYGLKITDMEYEKELQNIQVGKPSLKKSDYVEYFDIYQDDEYIGNIEMTRIEDLGEPFWEIGVAIFDQFSNKNYARKALKQFFDENKWRYKNERIEAIVRVQNPEKERIKAVLVSSGFSRCNDGEGDWCFERGKGGLP
ncbi:hypothetical protein SDC9_44024 [bioreactor metagenome]|uniref:N-acetyltransferase domain-containing protein n=1 Tax=bioreactor metagenome TaxID=1076179 RepID=A0A644W278_9ZZZZ